MKRAITVHASPRGWFASFRRRDRESGQATLEFLLMLPVLVIFILGLIDFGIMMYKYVSVSNAVREGARYAATNCGGGACTSTLVVNRTLERSGGILSDPGEITVGWMDTNSDGTSSGRGDAVVVRVEHTYTFLFFPLDVDVYSCADMRLEQRDRGTGLSSGSMC